jgi:hypothetical protein
LLAGAQIAPVARQGLELIVGLALAPALVIGLVIGVDPIWRRAILIFAAAATILVVLSNLMNGTPPNTPLVGGGPATPAGSTTHPVVSIGIGGLVLLLAVLVVLVLMRIWMRQTTVVAVDIDETRWIDRGEDTPGGSALRGRWRQRFRRRSPTGAAEAYTALIEEIATRPEVSRNAAETPAEHARRLRRRGIGALGLDLLAADYSIERFADERVTRSEGERAIQRWRFLRRHLGRN